MRCSCGPSLRDSGKLVVLFEHFRQNQGGDGFNAVAPGDYRDWRSQTRGFEDMAAMRGYGGILSGMRSELPEVVQSAGDRPISFHFSAWLPCLAASSQRPKTSRKVSAWSCSRGACSSAALPEILPSSANRFDLDTISTTVVGVLPSWFTYPDARIQFWLPYAQTFSPEDYAMHDGHQSLVVARLKPGVSTVSATREVSALQYRIHLANASKPVAEDVWSRPMIDDLVKDVRTPLSYCSVR